MYSYLLKPSEKSFFYTQSPHWNSTWFNLFRRIRPPTPIQLFPFSPGLFLFHLHYSLLTWIFTFFLTWIIHFSSGLFLSHLDYSFLNWIIPFLPGFFTFSLGVFLSRLDYSFLTLIITFSPGLSLSHLFFSFLTWIISFSPELFLSLPGIFLSLRTPLHFLFLSFPFLPFNPFLIPFLPLPPRMV